MELIPHCLTPEMNSRGIRSLTSVGIPVRTLDESVLYPRGATLKAIPKYVSERTSYHAI